MKIDSIKENFLRAFALAVDGDPQKALNRVAQLNDSELANVSIGPSAGSIEENRPLYESVGEAFLNELRQYRKFQVGLFVCRFLKGEEFEYDVVNTLVSLCTQGTKAMDFPKE